MVFAFKLMRYNNKILLLGHAFEQGKELYVLVMDKDLNKEHDKRYHEQVMWVDNIVIHKNIIIVQNELSVICMEATKGGCYD